VSIQPQFKSELLNGVADFKLSVDQFVADYNEKYAHSDIFSSDAIFSYVQQ